MGIDLTQCNFTSRTRDGRWVCSTCRRPSRFRPDNPPHRPCTGLDSRIETHESGVVTPKEYSRQVPKKKNPLPLGDHVEQALTILGITSDRVSKWLGRPCKCPERKEKLNQLGAWAAHILSGKTEDAKKHLEDMIE